MNILGITYICAFFLCACFTLGMVLDWLIRSLFVPVKERTGCVFVPENRNPDEISGPRKFTITAVQMQRAHGWTWLNIILDWLYAWFFVPPMVLLGWYPHGPITRFMLRGTRKHSNPYNWWHLEPNWCARWSARKAWGNRNRTLVSGVKLMLALALCMICWRAGAQTTTNSPQQNFFQTTMSYFSSFNTNLTTFRSDFVNVELGTASINNENMTEELALTVSPFKFGVDTNTGYASFDLNYIGRNATIAGTLVQQEGGIGLSKSYYDVKGSVYVDGGYDFTKKQWYPAIGFRVRKALTPNTYAGVGLEEAFRSGNTAPTLSIFAGFKF